MAAMALTQYQTFSRNVGRRGPSSRRAPSVRRGRSPRRGRRDERAEEGVGTAGGWGPGSYGRRHGRDARGATGG